MNQDEFIRQQQRDFETSQTEHIKRNSELAVQRSEHNLELAKDKQNSLKKNISQQQSSVDKQRQIVSDLSNNNIQKTGDFFNSIYPYYLKNKIYQKVLEDIFMKCTGEEVEKYKQIFEELKKEKNKDSSFCIEVFNKQKKTSNF